MTGKFKRIALMGTVAAAPLLLGMASGALAQQAPVPSFPGAIPIPGTDTQLKVGGYAKADFWYDHGAHQDVGGNGGATGVNYAGVPLDNNVPGSIATPGHHIHGVSRISAAESRFNFETRTPTAYGLLSTVIEADFESPNTSGAPGTGTGTNGTAVPGPGLQVNSDSYGARLRLAYGTLGPFLAGQTAPLFRDPGAEPEVLDFGGALGANGPLRQPEFRYTYAAGGGISLAIAIDNPQTQFLNATAQNTALVPTVNNSGTGFNPTFGTGQGDKVPDLVEAVTFGGGFGHISLRAVERYLYDNNGGGPGGAIPAVNVKKFGWGGALTGDINTFIGKDHMMFEITGGDGVGRYSTNTGSAPGDLIVNPITGASKALPLISGLIAYQHYWSTQLRSTVEYSYLRAFYPSDFFTPGVNGVPLTALAPTGVLGQQNVQLNSAHGNLIYSPVPAVDLGYEFIWAARKTVAGQTGYIYRSQVSAKFRF